MSESIYPGRSMSVTRSSNADSIVGNGCLPNRICYNLQGALDPCVNSSICLCLECACILPESISKREE